MAKKFVLEVELGNLTMESYDDIADLLERVGKSIALGGMPAVGEGNGLRDRNGILVGEWAIKGEEEDNSDNWYCDGCGELIDSASKGCQNPNCEAR